VERSWTHTFGHDPPSDISANQSSEWQVRPKTC
jgi:hypothetical protein